MSEQKQKGIGTGWMATGITLTFFLLFVAYVLSAGPGLWLVQKRYLSEAAYEAIYFPLLFLTDRVAWADGLLTPYCRWWVGK